MSDSFPDDLPARLRDGDVVAFDTIVRRHRSAVYGYLRARLTKSDDALSLTKDVFRTLYGERSRIDAEADLRATLIAIAARVLNEHLRRSRRSDDAGWTGLCLSLDEAGQSASEEQPARLSMALNELEPAEREAIELTYRSGWTPSQIAARLRRGEGAVKQLVFRARQKLRQRQADLRPDRVESSLRERSP